jgi:hypothetical protein
MDLKYYGFNDGHGIKMRYPSDWKNMTENKNVTFTPINGAPTSLKVENLHFQNTQLPYISILVLEHITNTTFLDHTTFLEHTTLAGLPTIVDKASPETKSFSYFFNAPENRSYIITYSVPLANNASYFSAIKKMIY